MSKPKGPSKKEHASQPSKREQCELLAFVLWVGGTIDNPLHPEGIDYDNAIEVWGAVTSDAHKLWMRHASDLYDALQKASRG